VRGNQLELITKKGCFASILAKALFQNGYNEIMVGGYPGLIGVRLDRAGTSIFKGQNGRMSKVLTVVCETIMDKRDKTESKTLKEAGWKKTDLAVGNKNATSMNTGKEGWAGAEQVWFDGQGKQYSEADIKALKKLARGGG